MLKINGANIPENSVTEVQEEQIISISASHSSGIAEIQYISGDESARKIPGGSTSLWYAGSGTVALQVSATAVNGASSGFSTYILNITPKPKPAQPPAPAGPSGGPPAADFIQIMFDGAIQIPESDNKIEPPPYGRSEELQYGIIPLSDDIPEPFEYFKNIIILGDSVTLGFDVFSNRIKYNGENVISGINIVSSGSYGVNQASKPISADSVHPRIGGAQYYPEDIIARIDAKNVLICLGLNDTFLSIDNYILHYSNLINKILAKSPDKNIVIASVTPVTRNQQKLSGSKIAGMNNALIEFAMNNGYMFIDYGAAIRDADGFLYTSLSSDDYCHLTVAAYNRIVEYMLYHPIK
jgi:lysophospholipase L1-like esterase